MLCTRNTLNADYILKDKEGGEFMKHALRFVMVLVLVLGLSSMASAYQATFFGEDLGQGENTRLAAIPNASGARANFLSNLVGVGTEDFEGFTTGASLPQTLTFPSAGSATLSGSGMSISTVTTGTNGVGRYPISGANYLEGSSSAFSVAFANPVAAFGFYGIDIGHFNGQVKVTFVKGGTTVYTIP